MASESDIYLRYLLDLESLMSDIDPERLCQQLAASIREYPESKEYLMNKCVIDFDTDTYAFNYLTSLIKRHVPEEPVW